MPSPAITRPRTRAPRRCQPLPQLEREVFLSPTAIARQVIEEASHWLGVPLPGRYAAGLAFRAHRCYAHSPSFREKIRRPGERGRDLLYVFMRHWLTAQLLAERPDLHAQLPPRYALGEAPPTPVPVPVTHSLAGVSLAEASPWLSPEARLLLAM